MRPHLPRALVLLCSLVGLIFLVQGQPSAPRLATPENGEFTNDNTPYFSWENLTGENILNYRLVVDNDSNFADGDNFYDNSNLTDNFDNFDLHPENALPEGTWYWHVRGENADGLGAWSKTWSLAVVIARPAEVPAEVAIFTVVSLGATVVVLGVGGYFRYARGRREKQVILWCAVAVAAVITTAYLLLFA